MPCADCAATVAAFRARLGTDAALAWLRETAAPQLPALPTPVGFAHHAGGMGNPPAAVQQRMGRDPPATPAQRSPQRPPRRRARTRDMAKTPDDDLRQAVALFRHGLIAALVNLPPGTRGIGARLRAKAASSLPFNLGASSRSVGVAWALRSGIGTSAPPGQGTM